METMKPDVLVSDITMPEYDGFWLLREARRRRWLDGVATLATTALELRPQQITDGGFDSYLRKPVDPNELCDTVQRLARGRKEPRR
jgi:CheY-like chemotaxis protein